MLDADVLLLKTLGVDSITPEDAMQIPAYAASVNFIAGTIASLPIKLYEENGEKTEEVRRDSRLPLLNGYTGDLVNTENMLRGMITDYFNRGGGYAYVEKTLNTPRALHYVSAKNVSVLVKEDPIFHDADICVGGRVYKPYEFIRIVRDTKDGVKGIGIPEQSPLQLAATFVSLKYELQLMRGGGNKKGVLTSEKRIDEASMERLRESWKQLYSNADSGAIVLNAGVDFKETSASSVDLQINENKITNAGEISRLFGLSPAVTSGEASAEKLVNAIRVAVMPVITKLQDAFNDALLLHDERGRRYFAFDTAEMMRGDILRRYQAYKLALDGNFMQPDEVRYREDLPPLGLNFVKLGLNDVLYDPKTKTVYTPNTDKATKLDGKEVITDESGTEEQG